MYLYRWENIILELPFEKQDFSECEISKETMTEHLKQENPNTMIYLRGFEAPCHLSKAIIAYNPHLVDWKHHESIGQFSDALDPQIGFPQGGQQEEDQPSALVNVSWIEKRMAREGLSVSAQSFFETLRACLESSALQEPKSVNLLGLGDVGLTLAIGLKLLGQGTIKKIGLYDINPKQRRRMMIELSQIIVNPEIEVVEIEASDLFSGDAFIFCASKYVPAVGEKVDDVRMMQLASNASLIKGYAQMAREQQYKGLFCVVSDPVDLLCRAVFDYSNQDQNAAFDFKGLLPDQIIGFGLGVMHGRAAYYGGEEYSREGRVFGPHGKDLVVANSIEHYNEERSLSLTEKVITANLEVRDLGYKPYIAPAISSGAYSIINMLKGQWHYSAQFLGGQFWGNYHRRSPWVIYESHTFNQALMTRMENAYERLGQIWETFGA